jgi:hypothetical protein
MVCRVRKTELIETKWEEIDFDKAERSRIFFQCVSRLDKWVV